MTSWDVARLVVRLGDYNLKTTTETRHIEKRVKRVVRHRGFDPRTLVSSDNNKESAISPLTLEFIYISVMT